MHPAQEKGSISAFRLTMQGVADLRSSWGRKLHLCKSGGSAVPVQDALQAITIHNPYAHAHMHLSVVTVSASYRIEKTRNPEKRRKKTPKFEEKNGEIGQKGRILIVFAFFSLFFPFFFFGFGGFSIL